MKTVCKMLSDKGLVDYISIIAHTNVSHTGRSKHWPPTPAPHGLFVDLASAIKAEVTVPVFTVGRIVDPAHADRIIVRNQADMVGMTRAHICDPTIVSKIKMGNPQQVRPCVGANTCIANRYAGKTICCMHNPELKSPGKVLMPAKVRQTISVIGAGPAGLEAAERLLDAGASVEIVTEDVAVAHDVDATNRNAWYERLGKRGVKFTAQTVVTRCTQALRSVLIPE